jgi:hypothetical protein
MRNNREMGHHNCDKCGLKYPHTSKCKNDNCISICMIREWRDCDSNKTNSSQIYINHDPNYCWRCRDRFPPFPPKNNGIVTCSSSLIGVCGNLRFKDCDENASNRCKTNVQKDDDNCGGYICELELYCHRVRVGWLGNSHRGH